MRHIIRIRAASVTAVAAATLLSGCEPSPIAHSGGALHDTELDTSISAEGSSVTVSYTLRNTGSGPAVAYNRGWVADVEDPQPDELRAEQSDVQVVVDGDKLEFALRNLRDCDTDDCASADAPAPHIVGTEIDAEDELSDSFVFDADAVPVDHPASEQGSTVSLAGMTAKFCLGVARPKHPAAHDMYPPTADETVLCGEAVDFPED